MIELLNVFFILIVPLLSGAALKTTLESYTQKFVSTNDLGSWYAVNASTLDPRRDFPGIRVASARDHVPQQSRTRLSWKDERFRQGVSYSRAGTP